MLKSEKIWNILLKSLLIFLFFLISLSFFGNQRASADAPYVQSEGPSNSNYGAGGGASGCGGGGGGAGCGGGG